jgi:hypothetical protein
VVGLARREPRFDRFARGRCRPSYRAASSERVTVVDLFREARASSAACSGVIASTGSLAASIAVDEVPD